MGSACSAHREREAWLHGRQATGIAMPRKQKHVERPANPYLRPMSNLQLESQPGDEPLTEFVRNEVPSFLEILDKVAEREIAKEANITAAEIAAGIYEIALC